MEDNPSPFLGVSKIGVWPNFNVLKLMIEICLKWLKTIKKCQEQKIIRKLEKSGKFEFLKKLNKLESCIHGHLIPGHLNSTI